MMFRSRLEDLNRAGVRYVVIGGVAATLHGSASVTFDLDVCYDPARTNRERLSDLLRSWGAYLRGVEPGLPFELDAQALATSHVLTLTTRLGDVDIMDNVAGIGGYAEVAANAVELDVGDGLRCRILDLPALIRAKRAAGRSKDKQQLPELEALLELTKKRRR